MQIVLIVIFASLLSLPKSNLLGPFGGAVNGLTATLGVVLGATLLIPAVTGLVCWVCLRRLRKPGGFSYAAMLFGRIHLGVRIALLGLFGLLVFETGWVKLVRVGWHLGRYPLIDELVLVGPVLLAAVLCWLVMYPTDRALRVSASGGLGEAIGQPVWTLGQYLDFQIRYQVLTVLVPMSLFILASDLMSLYGRPLVAATGVVWLPELLQAVVAGTVFVFSPVMLRHLWKTQKLPASALRSRLEATCRRLGLRYREILVWQSHGAMVNAAVMGLLPQIRYILLSDGLLDHLSEEQVESVFGHEAGHVKERHITYYMLFAIASMIAVGLAGEWLERELGQSEDVTNVAVMGMVVAIWGIGFGWISRRFERQADLHGVRCVQKDPLACTQPCWVHSPGAAETAGERLCATAAGVFASALEAVAMLNGISKYARSWRHSSIASRQAFVRQAAFYPEILRRFEGTVSRIKLGLLAVTLSLAIVSAWFYWPMLQPGGQHLRSREGQYRQGPAYRVEGRRMGGTTTTATAATARLATKGTKTATATATTNDQEPLAARWLNTHIRGNGCTTQAAVGRHIRGNG